MRPMDVKQREIAPQPGVRAHRACAFFGAVSLLLSLSTWSEIGSLGPFIEAAPVALVAYRSDLGEAGAVDHPVGVVAEPHRPTTLRLSSGDAAAWLVDGGAPNRGASGDDAACEHVFAVPGATATVVATARKIVRKTATYEFTVFVKRAPGRDVPDFKGSAGFFSTSGRLSERGCFYRNARARHTHVEAPLHHPCAAQVRPARAPRAHVQGPRGLPREHARRLGPRDVRGEEVLRGRLPGPRLFRGEAPPGVGRARLRPLVRPRCVEAAPRRLLGTTARAS